MPYVDFAELKSRMTITQVAELLGLKTKPAGHQLRAPCPACQSGGDRALVITPEKELFYCFAAREGGDLIKLAAHVWNCTVPEAAQKLSGGGTVRTVPKESGTSTVPKEALKALDYLDSDHELVVACGFSPTVAKALGIGYAPKGIMRGTVAIPIRDEHGTLQGYIGVTEPLALPKDFMSNVVPLRKTAS